MQVSNEEAKSVEISRLQKVVESLNLELDASKLATINECNKNAVLQNQLELSGKEKSALERELIDMAELRKENAVLKVRDAMLIDFLFFIFFYYLVRCDIYADCCNFFTLNLAFLDLSRCLTWTEF